MAININSLRLKRIFKHLLNEKTSMTIGNLAYLSLLALAPTAIIITSFSSVFSRYINIENIPIFIKIHTISNSLNLNQTSNLLIILICINLLSSGIFSLLSTLEKIYNFQFENYIRKKLYSLALSLILLLTIMAIIITSFLLTQNEIFKKIDFLINLISIFISILFFYKLSTFQKLKNLYSGALISSFFLTIFLNFFYYIIKNFSNLTSYYGLLAPVIISVLLIYYSCYIVYLGIILNADFSKHK